MPEFVGFRKIPRYSREIIVSEKIDGTNASIFIGEDGEFLTGSRTRWITPIDDNMGFSRWAHEHKDELMQLGPGTHHGEWWGSKIQRAYGLKNGERHFSLFNISKWGEVRPACCDVVPIVWRGEFDNFIVDDVMAYLARMGSLAMPGYNLPEGIVIFHVAGNYYFKKTFGTDGGKGAAANS